MSAYSTTRLRHLVTRQPFRDRGRERLLRRRADSQANEHRALCEALQAFRLTVREIDGPRRADPEKKLRRAARRTPSSRSPL